MKERILVLGITGMLGSKFFLNGQQEDSVEVLGTCRTNSKYLPDVFRKFSDSIYDNINADNLDDIEQLISRVKPDYVINCIGLIKQQEQASNRYLAVYLNSFFPHAVARICEKKSVKKFIHISTDCVFTGKKGNYNETDISDAEDIYGKSKFLGEVIDLKNAITLRTSIIGHELDTRYGLVEWFLHQENTTKGYTNAIFSGLTTTELTKVIINYVLKNPQLNGLYHVSVNPVAKFDLLNIIADVYKKDIQIIPSDEVNIDRSLNSEKFRKEVGYEPPSWHQLIEEMYSENF